MNRFGTEVAVVTALGRHPVKSFAGEWFTQPGEGVELDWTGVKGDRRFGFVIAENGQSKQKDFPWFTGREYPSLVLYKAWYDDPANPKGSLTIETPGGRSLAIDSPELRAELSEMSGLDLFLLRLGRGAYDGMPVSLMGVATIEAVRQRTKLPSLDPRRFRPNILVQTRKNQEGEEDSWVGGTYAIGDENNPPRIVVAKKDPRCMMINIDPLTGKQTPQVLRDVVIHRGNEMGVYASVVGTGMIRVGDIIRRVI